jgi:hypothetical protein
VSKRNLYDSGGAGAYGIHFYKKKKTPHILYEIFWKYDKQNQVLFITSKETLGNFSDILSKS